MATICVWALAADFALEEIVVNTRTHDPLARQRSYELIAAASDAEAAGAR